MLIAVITFMSFICFFMLLKFGIRLSILYQLIYILIDSLF